jgi:hypothetical protein
MWACGHGGTGALRSCHSTRCACRRGSVRLRAQVPLCVARQHPHSDRCLGHTTAAPPLQLSRAPAAARRQSQAHTTTTVTTHHRARWHCTHPHDTRTPLHTHSPVHEPTRARARPHAYTPVAHLAHVALVLGRHGHRALRRGVCGRGCVPRVAGGRLRLVAWRVAHVCVCVCVCVERGFRTQCAPCCARIA